MTPGTIRAKDAIPPEPMRLHTVMRYGYTNKERKELKDAIEPNHLHLNNLYATTKPEHDNLQERSNN